MAELEPIDPVAYNYATFPPDTDRGDFAKFVELLPVGQTAPDSELTRLDDGERVKLSEYWQRGLCVIEFGSITCPYWGMAGPSVEPLAERFAPLGVQFIFVYTRESQPG